MNTACRAVCAGLLALAGLAGSAGAATPMKDAASPKELPEPGIDVLTKGPVHEGFAQPTTDAPEPGPLVPKQPPAPVPEEPPDQKPEGPNVQWVPGYWSWDANKKDWLWVSGIWRNTPPDRKWVPGHWTKTDDGWRWVNGFWVPSARRALNYLDEPPATLDIGPSIPAPDDDSIYVPGAWVYRETRFLWRPGYWLGCRAGWTWSAAHYVWTPSGFVYVDGYWDYPLEDRGVLFAPVCFSQPLWATAGWCYRPSFVVSIGGLFGSFWVRPSCGYFFGDYYDPCYARLGFQPWFAFGARHYDPLFNYYGWNHRSDPGWLPGLRSAFNDRMNGNLVRPPATFAAQTAAVTAAAIANTKPMAPPLVTPLAQVSRSGTTKFTTLDSAQMTDQRQAIKQIREQSVQRGQTEGPKAKNVTTFTLPARGADPAPKPKDSGTSKATEARVVQPKDPSTPGITSNPSLPSPAAKNATPTFTLPSNPGSANATSPPPPPAKVTSGPPPVPVHAAAPRPPPPVRVAPAPPPPTRGGGGHSSGGFGGGGHGGGGHGGGHKTHH